MANKSRKEPFWERFSRFLEDYGDQLGGLVGDIGIVVFGVTLGFGTPDLWKCIGFFISIVIMAVSRICSLRKTIHVRALREEKARLEYCTELAIDMYKELVSAQLSKAANSELQFGDTERISVFRHDGQVFLLIGRYSKNPNYNKSGRSFYPTDQGILSEAWTNGSALISSLPDPNAKDNDYHTSLKQWKITKSMVKKLTMKSRCLSAYALEDWDNNRIAVVCFESMNPDKFKGGELDNFIKSDYGSDLADFLARTAPFAPTISHALKRGF